MVSDYDYIIIVFCRDHCYTHVNERLVNTGSKSCSGLWFVCDASSVPSKAFIELITSGVRRSDAS